MAVAVPAVARHHAPGGWRHATLVVCGFVVLCGWVFAQPLTSGRLLAESDLFDQYLPLFRAPALVWSSFEFSGVPAFADPESSAFYPPRWLFATVIHSWNGFIVSAFVLAGCFTYAYLFVRTRSRVAAAFGGVGFVLSEAMIERVPHANILHAVVWIPLIVLSLDAMRRSRSWPVWVALAAFGAASCVLAGHPQIAVYAAYVCGAYAVIGLIVERAGLAQWLRVAAAAGIAVLLTAVSVLPLAELSRYSVRQSLGFTEFVDYSNTRWQMLSALFPVITHPGLEAPTYVGLAVLLCAAIGAFLARSDWRIGFWLLVAVGGLMLGAGDSTPLARVMYELPLYDRFRIVARHLVFAAFGLNVLAAYGVAAMVNGRVSRRAVACACGLFALAIAGGAVLLARSPDAVRFDHVNEASPLPWLNDRVWIQLVLAIITLAAVIATARHRRSRLSAWFLVGLLAVDLVRGASYDWARTGLAMVTVDPAAAAPGVHARTLASRLAPTKQRFIAVPDSLRDDVVPGLFARPWQLANAGGYTSLLLQDVAALARVAPNGRVEQSAFAPRDAGLDLLAVKYVVARAEVAAGIEAIMADVDTVRLPGDPRWRRVDGFATSRITDRNVDEQAPGETAYVVFENRHALPRAWLASEVLPATDGVIADAVRTSRMPGGRIFEPATTALVFEGELGAARYRAGGSASVAAIADSRITVNVSSPDGGFLVLSEAYYPGWQARIDAGTALPVHKTDVALQGITVPRGDHTVTFEFVSRARRLGLGLAAAGILALAVMLVAGLRTGRS